MEKRYQVFVSSTYKDLTEERNEVIKALLELDCIPCGMEYFPAADESQWDFIKKLVEESDYYIVLVAWKLGTLDENGLSYTRKEYEYAIEKGIPTIGFIRNAESILVKDSEEEPGRKAQLDHFRELVAKKLCKFWSTPQELGAVVSRSLSQAKKNYPRVGWVRADNAGVLSEKEVVQLYKKIESLETQLANLNRFEALITGELAQGDETISLSAETTIGPWNKRKSRVIMMETTWDEVASYILPRLLRPIREPYFKAILNSVYKDMLLIKNPEKTFDAFTVSVTTDTLITVKIQFQALNLMNIVTDYIKTDNGSKEMNTIKMTQKGHAKLLALRAIKTPSSA